MKSNFKVIFTINSLTPLYVKFKILLGVFLCIWLHACMYSKTCLKWQLLKRPKIGFQDQLWLNAGQKYAFCNTLDLHLAIICH